MGAVAPEERKKNKLNMTDNALMNPNLSGIWPELTGNSTWTLGNASFSPPTCKDSIFRWFIPVVCAIIRITIDIR